MKRKLITTALLSLAAIPLLVVIAYRFDPEVLTRLSFYLNLANPSMRIVRLDPGLRKEQVAERLTEKLEWNEGDKEEFLAFAWAGKNPEGRFFPKTYLIHKNEKPTAVGIMMSQELAKEMDKIGPESVLNEETILTIASIIEREAAGPQDMALISGILWNRIWNGMKLQVDATLQYAKGSTEGDTGGKWWPPVTGTDRKIKSPYNTYMFEGLPPFPISSPSAAAIKAAFNPAKTKCLFFIHDKNRNIHCTRTYEAHKQNVEIYLK